MSRKLNRIDKSIGSRLRDRRTSRGLSREQLAERLQIDPKDIELYETGVKRITADRLLRIAKTLGVRPVYFFGFSDNGQRNAGELDQGSYENASAYLTLPDQGFRLHQAFFAVKNSALREALVALVVEIGKNGVAAFECEGWRDGMPQPCHDDLAPIKAVANVRRGKDRRKGRHAPDIAAKSRIA